MASEERLLISVDMQPTHRYFIAAWMFLEDAAHRASEEREAHKRIFQLQRLLGACAISLRMACEAKFGDLSKVPDENLMWFVTAARHISAHVVSDEGRAVVTAVNATWSNENGSGIIETEVVIDLDLEKAKIDSPSRRKARDYLHRHGNDAFLALHAAAETISGWLNETIDDDFRALKTQSAGRFKTSQPIKDSNVFKRLIEENAGVPLSDGSPGQNG